MDLSNLQNQDNEENYNEEEFCDNDIYLIELHKRLAMMKKDRKKAEQDATLLDNRLKLLKGEEEKVSFIYFYLFYNFDYKFNNFRLGKKLKSQRKRHKKKL
jgi:hypothetical protein